jgi:hypothetical protein
LRVEDEALKRVRKALGRFDGRRGIAILYSEGLAVYANYKDDSVGGEYPLTKVKLPEAAKQKERKA